jgi:hypothetical protein
MIWILDDFAVDAHAPGTDPTAGVGAGTGSRLGKHSFQSL